MCGADRCFKEVIIWGKTVMVVVIETEQMRLVSVL